MLKASAPLSESARSQESKADRERRRALGIYYTPPEAAMVLARWAIRRSEDTVLEPSFGGCAMLSAAASIFKSLGNDRPSNQLYGFDVDAAAFTHLAQIGIDNANGHFKKQDFLLSKAGDLRVDAVLANPPFVSYHRLDEAQRLRAETIRCRYLPQMPRIASLWAHFVLHSLSYLRAGGRMAFVLPNAVGNADYAQPLLGYLSRHFARTELVHLSERLFIQAGADERISLLLLSGFAPAGAQAAPLLERNVDSITTVGSSEDEFVYSNLESKAAEALADIAHAAFIELGSVATVRIGEVVGDIPVFVRPLGEWQRLNVPSKYLMPLLTRSSQVKGLYATESESKDAPSPIPHLLLPPQVPVPQVINDYLAQYSLEEIESNRTFAKRQIWYRCTYDTNAAAFFGSMSHDYPRIIGNRIGISCSNSFYKISTPERPDLASWLPILSLTTPMRLSAEILGRVRGSGGIKLEPSDVRKLLIPTRLPILPEDVFESHRKRLETLVRSGELDAACQFADSLVYLQPGLVDARTMSGLRLMRIALTSRRLTRPRSGD